MTTTDLPAGEARERGIGSQPVLEVRGLQKYFPIKGGILSRTVANVKAVEDVDLKIKSGEVVVGTAGPQLRQRLINGGVPAGWSPAEEGTLSWVCGFALSSTAQNTDAAYALMNFQASPEAQAIRAETGYLVTNPKAIPLAPKDYPELAGVETAKDALPETYPPNYPDWVKAFQEFKSS